MDKKRRRPYLRAFYRGNRTAFCFALLATVLVSALNLGITWLLQQMVDTASGVPGAFSLETMVKLTGVLLLLIVAVKGLNYLSKPLFLRRAMEQYKNLVFEKLTRKSIAAFQKEDTAVYLSALSNDAVSIETNYLDIEFDILFDAILMVGALGMMLYYSTILTVISVGLCLLPLAASLAAGDRMKILEQNISDRNSQYLATVKDSLNGFPVVKAFQGEGAMVSLFQKSCEHLEAEKCSKRRLSTLLSILGGLTGISAQFGTFLAGTWLMLSGFAITPGVLLVFLDLTANVINPVSRLPEYLARRKAALHLVDKLARILETNVREEGKALPGNLEQGITLENIGFSYGQEPILQDITTRFETGKCYAIVGASGSGKSTLLNLLLASQDTYTGTIRYDDMPLEDISSESLYGLVSMVQQNVFLFNASIRDNITMFQDFSREAVDRAIVQAGLTELIQQRGEEYRCGENGSGLSGGEKQRISIARSLLRKAKVLLVDEATASLDAQTAWQVSDAILNLEGLTRIVVTHSLDPRLLARYDGILTLKGGRIQESGTFTELMEKKGYFYSLYTVSQ